MNLSGSTPRAGERIVLNGSRFAIALMLYACTSLLSQAAEMFFERGAILVGSPATNMAIRDEVAGTPLAGEIPVVERFGQVINVYCRATVSPGPPTTEFICAALLDVFAESGIYTVNYFLSTKQPGGVYSSFALRDSDSLLVVSPGELRVTVEYYHSSLNHYFLTAEPSEQVVLDSGVIQGWQRTGVRFASFMPKQSVPSVPAVCRLYGLPSAGLNTHFYSSEPSECSAALTLWPENWVEETPNAFYVARPGPESGICPDGTKDIVRFYNGQADVNHRYVVSGSVQEAAMIDFGWIREGVVWCSSVPI